MRISAQMSIQLLHAAADSVRSIQQQGLYKQERPLLSPQSFSIAVMGENKPLINLCANNYLGLANHPALIDAAKAALDSHGFGMASVRFICGTQDLHQQLEQKLSVFLGTEDSLLFSSCFDANAGIFEVLLDDKDAIISDALNHASIIDGIRLCKAKRLRYANNDMDDLEAKLIAAQDARFRLIVTDGVFSMDGIIANLAEISALAEKYDALLMVDDSHSVGFMGKRGAGTAEHCGVEGNVHLFSGTFGKALGGASGGYIAGPKSIVTLLRQRARPYLFSNAVAPCIVAATLKALELVEQAEALRKTLNSNANYFRQGLNEAGFDLIGGGHPIIPVMIGEAQKAQDFAARLMDFGLYVTAFSYPGRTTRAGQNTHTNERGAYDKATGSGDSCLYAGGINSGVATVSNNQ